MSDPSTNTNTYGEVITNSQQTLSLGSALFEYFRPAWDAALERRKADKALRDGLGEWAVEAFDAGGRCQQPVLREDSFVTHLIENKATFQPSGSCNASFAWAKLLYALDIRPGANIIEWQSLGTDADPDKSDTVELKLEGPVLCHIVNLYQIYNWPSGALLDDFHRRGVTWPLSFGALIIHPDPDSDEGKSTSETFSEPRSWTATFRPDSNKTLLATRQPFLTEFSRYFPWSGVPLAFDADSIAINYVSTVKNSSSSNTLLGLPDPQDHLRTRCRSLCECFATLNPTLDTSTTNEKPYLVTPSWIKEASRIKRRVTTNGGADNGLVHHLVQFLLPRVKERRRKFNIEDDDEDLEVCLQEDVETLCFYEDDSFVFIWDGIRRSRRAFTMMDHVKELLPEAVKSLSQGSPKAWLSSLGEMTDEVCQVLLLRQRIMNIPVLVLELASDHPLWKSTCYIEGRVPTR
ncbi:uncharacterized protein F4822DRAFT_275654 [Hypoxylon trugodes]|uniref:uncharacterized protein n=1 Tax=Hypoxylon trugodes TaxID=326681 RepID=UPI002196459C|nr:uncharacterized protein F4822DRAFT_275654 [Hypoxylon trugodes]KAI1387169.1 hypothetical protein F4822DRAFT_275654 [Hypoxylon trugodes]